MAKFLKIRTPLTIRFSNSKSSFDIIQPYATDFQWAWPDAMPNDPRVNFAFYPPMHYSAHIVRGYCTIEQATSDLLNWVSDARLYIICQGYDQHESWMYFYRDSDNAMDIPVTLEPSSGHSAYPLYSGWRNYRWNSYWLTEWTVLLLNTSSSIVGTGSMVLTAECIYAFYDNDANYDLCLNDPMLAGFVEPCLVPDWYLEDNLTAPELSFRTVSAAQEHERVRPTPPPISDKPVYVFHRDTGWIKQHSIKIRASGVWLDSESIQEGGMQMHRRENNRWL